MAIQEREEMTMDPEQKDQIKAQIRAQSGVQVDALNFNKALTKVLAEYSDYNEVFSAENAAKLPENTGMNKYAIELEEGKQPPFGFIYSLRPMELETLKTYIKTNLANGFIRPSKFPAGAPILFDRKSDGSRRLCVDYWGLNNITIKNRYPLPLIGELLDWLGRAKRFIQLDLTNVYYRMRIRNGNEWKTAFKSRYGYFKY